MHSGFKRMDIEDLPGVDGGADAARRLRAVLGTFATGVTIVTTVAPDGRRLGLTVNSFSSVSLDPPLVLWALAKRSANLGDFLAARRFAVHVLAAHQAGLAERFARPAEDRFDGVAVRAGAGLPLLDDCAALLVCEAERAVDAGDHHLFIGRVVSMGAERTARDPLVFHRGRLTSIVPAGPP